jgi:hypothetical protein
MANLLVERSYTYIGRDTPTLFYYHPSCWAKAAPDALATLGEDVVVEVARGTVCLVPLPEDMSVYASCQQCGQYLHPVTARTRG